MTVFKINSYKTIFMACNKALEQKQLSFIVGQPGIGKSTSLQDYAFQNDEVMYTTVKVRASCDEFLIDMLLSSGFDGSLLSLEEVHKLKRSELLNIVVDTIGERGIKLIIIDNFYSDFKISNPVALLIQKLSIGFVLAMSRNYFTSAGWLIRSEFYKLLDLKASPSIYKDSALKKRVNVVGQLKEMKADKEFTSRFTIVRSLREVERAATIFFLRTLSKKDVQIVCKNRPGFSRYHLEGRTIKNLLDTLNAKELCLMK